MAGVSLLSSNARVQAPWIKVTIGSFTFGVFSKHERGTKDDKGFYMAYDVQYPNYIQSLNIVKINGQVNQYTLAITYPITQNDDPNFFEKVFSSVSSTRKIKFSYGDASMPSYVYKDEEAIITKVQQTFSLESSTIGYTVFAISGAALAKSGSYTFVNSGLKKPSDEIKKLFKNSAYGLQSLFTGMSVATLDNFIASTDKAVKLETKQNISILDYISYLASCMITAGTPTGNISRDIYVLTIHDDTTYDKLYTDRPVINGKEISGAYFKIEKANYVQNHSDAYEIDIGYNTAAIVTNFGLENNENYSLFYDYQASLTDNQYVKRLNNKGQWEDVYAPTSTSSNSNFETRPADISWWTKITKYPINATITIQGLLRPATLMTYVRLNVIFPGGHKHLSSGLYIVTKQVDNISASGYKTTLSLTKISGDDKITTTGNV